MQFEESSDEDEEPNSVRGGGRNKRVLANRQSAQRSRMRKLQFISDLENNVQQLQDDISKMEPALHMLRRRHAGGPHTRSLQCNRLVINCQI
jgi:predicted RNase H-like nuclease (RuvC/YqgF family)